MCAAGVDFAPVNRAKVVVIAVNGGIKTLSVEAEIIGAEIVVITIKPSAGIVAVRNQRVGASGQSIAAIRGAIIVVIAVYWSIRALSIGAGIVCAEVVIIAISTSAEVGAIRN